VTRLEDVAEIGPRFASWRTPMEESSTIDLGIAHGVAGVIGALAQVHHRGIEPTKCSALLSKACRWLLGRELAPGGASRFGAKWVRGGDGRATRLAWCYGDLGIAISLLAAARCLGDLALEATACDIALSAARRTGSNAGVIDASLCHGAFGVAHLFNRLYQTTGLTRLGLASRHWFTVALDLREEGVGIGGYSARKGSPGGDGALRNVPDVSFLTGAVGIALILLGATTKVEPTWDRVILASGGPLTPILSV
jgi:lantibiotic modifying enzyme